MIKCRHCRKEYDDNFSYCPYCAEPAPPKPPTEEELRRKEEQETSELYAMLAFGIPILAFLAGALLTLIISLIVHFVKGIGYVLDGYTIPQIPDFVPNPLIMMFCGAVASFAAMAFGIIAINRHQKMMQDLKAGKPVKTRPLTRKELIREQFRADQTSICPRCGSHSISLGRKGYDWNKAIWYSIFRIKGGHYFAGENSRRVTAYCNNCHHFWVTNQEWLS